jgi:hypothetical protein
MPLQPSPLLRGFEQGADGTDTWNRMMPGEERGPLALDPQGVALGQQFQAIKAGIEAQQARPIWNPDNPVGTETTLPQQSMGMPDPSFRPGVFVGGGTVPMSQEQIEGMRQGQQEFYDQASLLAGVGPAAAEGRVVTSASSGLLAKDAIAGYKPPTNLPSRAASMDYPQGLPVDEFGNITHSIEGVPLTAKNVAGRRAADASGDIPDRGIGLLPTVRLAKGAGEGTVLATPQKDLGRNIGDFDTLTNNIRYLNTLPGDQAELVITHEVGHLIDTMAGRIKTNPSMNQELEAIYHTLATGKGVDPKVMTTVSPENRGYHPSQDRPEYMAEAIRAYIQDPNWIKSVAPRTAQVIRNAVNSHPELSKWIQFNTAAGVVGGAAALAGGGNQEQ